MLFTAENLNNHSLLQSSWLLTESSIVGTDRFYVSTFMGQSDKTDIDANVQAVVLDKLGNLLVCLP